MSGQEDVKNSTAIGDTNNVNSSFGENSEYMSEIRLAEGIINMGYNQIMPIILFFGIVGNIFNIFIFNHKCMKAVTYSFFRYLSVSDLIAVISWCFVCIGMKSNYSWMLLTFMYIYSLAINTSIMLFTAVCIERYFSMCVPSKSLAIQNPRFSRFLIIGIIVINVIILIFHIALIFSEWQNEVMMKFYVWIYFLITRIIPSLLIIASNIRMAIEFRKIIRTQVDITNPEDVKKARRENRLVLMLLYTALLYVVCEVPFILYIVIAFHHGYSERTSAVIHIITACMEKINSATSFYIYFFTIKKFRHIVLTPFKNKLKGVQASMIDEEDTNSEVIQVEREMVENKE